MNTPSDIREAVIRFALYWIDSIKGFAFFDGRIWHRYDNGRFVKLTDEDFSTLGSCLGL